MRQRHRPLAAQAVGRLAHPLAGQAGLLGGARDQGRALLGLLALLGEPEGDRGDVVAAAAAVGRVDQLVDGAAQGLRLGEDLA